MKLDVRSFIICLLFILGCKKESPTLELEVEVEKYFTENQIEDLHKINNFFIEEYLKSDKSNYKSDLLKFLNYVKSKGHFSQDDEALFKKQNELYNSISKSTFNEIWKLEISKDLSFPNEKYISANINGKYVSLLKSLKNKTPFLKIIIQKIEKSGEFNSLFIDSYFFYNKSVFEYGNFYNQLTLAIYFLSDLDYLERDLKRKKRNEEFIKKANKEFESR